MACPTGKIVIDSKDPRINYNLLPGEELMTCPYNHSHALLPIKFTRHVLNCHRVHVMEMEKRGKEPLFKICQYDRSHHVRKEELAHHEANCEARAPDDDWGDIIAEVDAAKAKAEMKPKVKVEGAAAGGIPEPPPIDEASMKAIQDGESWEEEANYPAFDPNKRIHELRMQGYKVINTQEVIGLSKSEKRTFYETDQLAMDMYTKIQAQKAPSKPPSMKSATSSVTSTTRSSLSTLVEEDDD